ncbi:MAG: DoxX family protein [Balneolaceae bacterium]|nr:DoxX family protein [Balneolaceae bacterium]
MIRHRKSGQYRNIGLLLLRIGLGIMFILHGFPKVSGGPEVWVQYGEAAQFVGLNFAPMFFGFMAGITELFGGIFLILGLFFKPTVALLAVVMVVATAKHIASGAPFSIMSHSIEIGIVCLSLLLIGPGKHSLDIRMKSRRW